MASLQPALAERGLSPLRGIRLRRTLRHGREAGYIVVETIVRALVLEASPAWRPAARRMQIAPRTANA